MTLNPAPVEVNGENLPLMKEFTYLGSIVKYDKGADSDIKSHLSKAKDNFRMLSV